MSEVKGGLWLGAVAVVSVPLLVVVMFVGAGNGSPSAAAAGCGAGLASAAEPSSGVPSAVAGYSGVQLQNAAAIVSAGKALGLPARGQAIGVMTAMGESGLRVIDYGDGAGPDSRGLFQQRPNGAWGSYADRMSPAASAGNFFRALLRVRGWEQLEPSIAAHRVQGNADPFHYEPYWPAAVEVVAALEGLSPASVGGAAACGLAAGSGDDLPWGHGPVGAVSPLGMFTRECVDFALWRVNQELGSTGAPFRFTDASFRGDGVLLGSAATWRDGWQAKGWPTGKAPQPGAVAWYAPGTGGADPTWGHVAVVKAVNPDGSYLEEGYNGNPAPDDHAYYTRTVQDTIPSLFLYVPTAGDGTVTK